MCVGGYFGPCFDEEQGLSALSSFAITSLKKNKLVVLFQLYFCRNFGLFGLQQLCGAMGWSL